MFITVRYSGRSERWSGTIVRKQHRASRYEEASISSNVAFRFQTRSQSPKYPAKTARTSFPDDWDTHGTQAAYSESAKLQQSNGNEWRRDTSDSAKCTGLTIDSQKYGREDSQRDTPTSKSSDIPTTCDHGLRSGAQNNWSGRFVA